MIRAVKNQIMISYNNACSFCLVLLAFVLAQMVYGKDCNNPVGIEAGKIPDSRIFASSSYDDLSQGARGRLNIKYQPPMKSGWCAGESNQDQYLEIDLEVDSDLTGIATQGRGREPYKHWVSKYYVSFRMEDGTWFNFTKSNRIQPEVFVGNTDAFTTVFHSFNRTIKARYVRIHPVEWNNQICMRVELYGCLGKKLVIEDDDLLIMFIVLIALVFCFLLLLLILLLTMRRVLKLLERKAVEKERLGVSFRDSIDGERMFKMDRSVGDTYIPDEPKQGTLTKRNKNGGQANKNNSKGEIPVYATINKSKSKGEEGDSNEYTDRGKKKKEERNLRDASDPKTILVHADEEEEKRKREGRNLKKEKIEMIDL